MHRPAIVLILACLAALALLPGCGDDSQSAGDVAQEYVDARNDADSAKVCDLYTDRLRQRLGAEKCAEFISEQTSGGTLEFSVDSVEENGDTAVARLEVSGNTEVPEGTGLQVKLVKQGDEWKIDDFGVGGSGAPTS
jgi:hypothetical protein